MEYPAPAVAQERGESFRALPGAVIRIAGRRLGVVFSPPDLDQAEELLREIPETEMSEDSFVSWDPVDGPLSLNQGMAIVLAGFAFGSVIACLHNFARRGQGIPNRTIALHLGTGRV